MRRLEPQGVEQKKKKRPLRLELSHFGLHVTGLVFLAAGCLSAMLQRRYFDVGSTGGSIADSELLSLMNAGGFGTATAAVMGQLIELAAIPIFAFLLTEGAARTASFKKYFLRVLCVAVLCEVPYSLLWNGKIFLAWSHNPVFGTLMALAMLWFFRAFPEKTGSHIAIKLLAVLGFFLWCNFLGIVHGPAMVILTAVLWATRGKPILQTLAGLGTCLALLILSPVYFISALGLIPVHMYSGNKGRPARTVTYLAYPLLLLFFFFLSIF